MAAVNETCVSLTMTVRRASVSVPFVVSLVEGAAGDGKHDRVPGVVYLAVVPLERAVEWE
jgi:hypothetical protein